MKKLFGALIILLVCYIVFFDLTHGTLPTVNEEIESTMAVEASGNPFFEEKVMAGDTVLTIIERKLNTQIPVSIDKIVTDFVKLNNGIYPEKIQIGKTYRFPDYSN
ncbi:hypothetical protein ACFSO7_19135 [Bacillus sp. CGMCC 1.16607]|uniref:hypothetical protein n=1 Tax=Bacillus sp. CGMCC 1.16607 TaxID=3351842 RepID=UPI00363216BF